MAGRRSGICAILENALLASTIWVGNVMEKDAVSRQESGRCRNEAHPLNHLSLFPVRSDPMYLSIASLRVRMSKICRPVFPYSSVHNVCVLVRLVEARAIKAK